MSADNVTPIRGTGPEEPDRPSGYTPEVLKALAAADALLKQAEETLETAPIEEGSEADFEISEALKLLKDARYNVNWREEIAEVIADCQIH